MKIVNKDQMEGIKEKLQQRLEQANYDKQMAEVNANPQIPEWQKKQILDQIKALKSNAKLSYARNAMGDI